MHKVLEDLPGVLCTMDDIIIFGESSEEYDARVRAVFRRLEDNGVTLNFEKCEFAKSSITYIGHVVSADGIRADPSKVRAIKQMQQPKDVIDIRRFLGVANQLGKFIPNLSTVTQPLRDLLQKKNQWMWGPSQQRAFDLVKDELSKTPVLALYDPNRETTVSADASSYGLGAVLRQRTNGTLRPVAYASRAMMPTEQRYSQIEKEALATTWSLERFNDYLYGMSFHVETDHKPLASLLSSKKNLDKLSPRIQRFRMRLMRYMYTITHVPGKSLATADALSRAPQERPLTEAEELLTDEVTAQANLVVCALPATEKRLAEIRARQLEDDVCRQVMRYCAEGRPSHLSLPSVLRPYWQVQNELTIQNGLLLKGVRLVIPTCMRLAMLDKLHEGHHGVVRCRSRAQSSVWWPGLSRQLEELVRSCTACAVERRNPSEPMIASETVLRPWQKVGTDMFVYKKATYLLVVDYASSYVEIAKLSATTSPDVILHLRSIFARHGIPETVVSDNGPQYASYEFARFASEEGFIHVTSSPCYPQSNGKVQTVKAMLKKSVDPYGALLAYRTTSLECGYSPAQLLMDRQVRTSIPVIASTLQPRWDESKQLRDRQEIIKTRQTVDYDRYHRAQPLSTLSAGDPVWVQDAKIGGTVVGKAGTPRSYLVQTPTTCLRRNRRHLVPTPNVTLEPMATEHRFIEDSDVVQPSQTSPSVVCTSPVPSGTVTTVRRSGRTSVPPKRLDL